MKIFLGKQKITLDKKNTDIKHVNAFR